METRSTEKKKVLKPSVIIGVIILCAAIFVGINYFKPGRIAVVQAKYENGVDKEVWIYKRKLFGKKVKVKEISYFANGNKESEREYKNGKVNGWARLWHESGQLHMEATYVDNIVHGTRIAYHKNGQMFCKAEYENGKILRKKNWNEEGKEIYLPLDRE